MGDLLIRGASLAFLLALAACGGGGGGGAPVAPGPGFNGIVQSIAPAADGSSDVYVGGDFTVYRGAVVNGIARINADGARDAGFDVGTGFDGSVRSIAPASDGSGDVYVRMYARSPTKTG